MMMRDIAAETIHAITANMVRSSLTVLGIVIGIASVIAMIAIGQGARTTIQSNIQSIGSNLILVTPGFQRAFGAHASSGRGSAQTLRTQDAQAIAQSISSVAAVAPEMTRRYQVRSRTNNTNTQVIGTVSEYSTIRNVAVELGNFLSDIHNQSASRVAVIGPTTKEDLFGADTDALGQRIRINQVEFTVIGVTRPKGGTGFANQDDIVLVPLTTAQRYLSGDTYVTTISVQARDQQSMNAVQEDITMLLLDRHNISDPQQADFSVINQSDIVAAASNVANIFTTLLASIAGISLLVGGIGIMNMMLTTVTERTREIGLRKAIGGKRSDITTQFLAESVMLTFLGGILGVLLGWLLALGVERFGNIPTTISAPSILLAFSMAAAIGVLFGYYPARRAATLNPIEALRYE